MENIRHESDEVTPSSPGPKSNLEDIVEGVVEPLPIRLEKPLSPEPHYEDFLGMTAVIGSPCMRRLITVASRVGRTNSPVLITGESGVGKELIARAVHHFSTRAAKPFIDVNCAALPEHLMESELFGYERGAFSGADTLKP